jgi:plastocyanin
MAIWPVNIVGNPATFDATLLQPTAPVGTVYTNQGDVVFWNNTTTQTHQISLLGALPNKGIVTPNHQTDAFVVTEDAGTTIAYNCVLHPLETGKIIVTDAP